MAGARAMVAPLAPVPAQAAGDDGAPTPSPDPQGPPLRRFAQAGVDAGDGIDFAMPAPMATPALPTRFDGTRPATASLPVAPPAAALARRAAALESANRELQAFTRSVSHDLQAPLRQVLGFTALLAREAGPALSDAAKQHLEDIVAATTHMSAMVEALLDLSRAESAGLHPATVDLNAVVRAAIAEQAPRTRGRLIDWNVAPLPAVRGDRILLRQVFANLLSNAVKYSRTRGRARIDVGARAAAAHHIVFVRDNGVGFDPGQADRLFRAFERLHSSSEFEGAGVGLASVRRIVERHGGRVWAKGAAGRGATFFVALPRDGATVTAGSAW